jgi:ABC-2 type transport system ATP-binding protein
MTSSTSGIVLEASGLGVRFGGFTALDAVNLALEQGSITGLVGPNGAGKTTLIRILATLLRPTTGRAIVAGFDVVRRPQQVRARIGYLPDFAGIYLDMRVSEYLGFFADAHGLRRDAKRHFIERALKISNLADRREEFVENLSRGMRAKLTFVRALAGDPKLLLLDEPLSNLDPVARAEMLEIITGLRDDGATVLISSHILTDLEKVCDRAIFLARGRLVEEQGETQQAQRYGYRLKLVSTGVAPTETLLGIAGVVGVDRLEQADCWVVSISDRNAGPAVIRAIVESGLDVLEWATSSRSLEERLVSAVRRGES